MERAAILASDGRQQANILIAPFSCAQRQRANHAILQRIGKRIGLTAAERRQGWRIRLVAQVGTTPEPAGLPAELCRKIAANCWHFAVNESNQASTRKKSATSVPRTTRHDCAR